MVIYCSPNLVCIWGNWIKFRHFPSSNEPPPQSLQCYIEELNIIQELRVFVFTDICFIRELKCIVTKAGALKVKEIPKAVSEGRRTL